MPLLFVFHAYFHDIFRVERIYSAVAAEGGISADERPVSKKSKGHWARDVSAYDILEPIGEGTYGKVGPSVLPRR